MIYIAATHNENKIKEFDRILKPLGISVISAEECGEKLPEVNETGKTFAENAELKAKSACKATGMPAIADDSGLMVDALGGRPGVYSARYAGEGASDEEKIEKLMIELLRIRLTVSVQHILFVLFAVTSLMAVRLRLKALAMARLALHQEETMALAMTQFSSQMITKPLQSFQAYKRMQ